MTFRGRSVDVFFGPTCASRQRVQLGTHAAGGQFEVLFRLYGPEKPLFDKTWALPDIEKIS